MKKSMFAAVTVKTEQVQAGAGLGFNITFTNYSLAFYKLDPSENRPFLEQPFCLETVGLTQVFPRIQTKFSSIRVARVQMLPTGSLKRPRHQKNRT